MVTEIKKPAEQIIRDDVKRKRLRRVGFGLLFFGVLFMLVITKLSHAEGDVAGFLGLTSLAGSLGGGIMVAVSTKCPICDCGIYRSGACKCQPSRAARSAHIDDLKWRAARPNSGGGT